MKSLQDTYKVYNGVEIPIIGLGTWQSPNSDVTIEAVKAALNIGYRHVDTAAAYGNEACVGQAVRDSGLPRQDIFVTTKLWNAGHGYHEALDGFSKSLAHLGLDYVDLYLIHWPNPLKYRHHWQKANADAWRAIEELHEAGKIRAIGVSNFRPHHLDELLKTARFVPMVNQIRLCPGETQDETVDYCRERDILLEAYSPFGTGRVFDVRELMDLAVQYGKTVSQVCLRWSLQRGYLPLPKSVSPDRIRENADVFDFELSAEDMDLITGLKGCCGASSDPDHIFF